MPDHWTEDQLFLIEAIIDYRNAIEGHKIKEARKLTMKFAQELIKNSPGLQHRSINSVVQRLPYLDNLLAGSFEQGDYAVKDQPLYNTQPRSNSSKEPNLCNILHSYNGALKRYLKEQPVGKD